MKIRLKVRPKAKENKLVSYNDNILRVRVTAAPEKGKANQAVVQLLAKELHIPKQQVTILVGQTSPEKVVEVPDDTNKRLEKYFKKNRTLFEKL